jgi:hypothetical protein
MDHVQLRQNVDAIKQALRLYTEDSSHYVAMANVSYVENRKSIILERVETSLTVPPHGPCLVMIKRLQDHDKHFEFSSECQQFSFQLKSRTLLINGISQKTGKAYALNVTLLKT